MEIWKIRGGNPLRGSVRVQGAKNSVLPIMAASVLVPCRTELTNCPDVRDVRASMDILRCLGCAVEQDGDAIYIDSRPLCRSAVPDALMHRMRSSFTFLGAILGRCGEASLTRPGGCELGERPIDLHLEALGALGARFEETGERILCCADAGLQGTCIRLRYPSVGATENAMIAACAAKGETVIENAATEPEIEDLQNFLRQLGAEICGAGTHTIQIRGISPVERVAYRIMPDRIAGATMLCAAACTGGEIELRGAVREHLSPVTQALCAMGCRMREESSAIFISAKRALRASPVIETGPNPAFPTDAQPLLMAASLRAAGTSAFVENVFSDRFRHVEQFRRLGAEICIEGKTALVTGVRELYGAPVLATDLRAGAALLLAGLSARGTTTVLDEGHIARGYDALDIQLRSLGAELEILREMR